MVQKGKEMSLVFNACGRMFLGYVLAMLFLVAYKYAGIQATVQINPTCLLII